ncbi:MAG: ferritin [Bacteroidetes bacterium]|nr:MAG: ferritin [Bacteroidota bacterium]RLD95764.1 MAG: ferritin [Bacteroidota bacterium]
MKKISYRLSGWWVVAIAILLSITQCTESNGLDDQMTPGSEKNESGIQGSELTEAEIDGIRFMREEEKVARDVYIYLYEIHPLRPFLNISKSEQAHMDAIKYLIDAFDIEDPVGENPEGVFQNEELQELYDALIEKGSTSREEALRVAALIEEVDIIDLRTELDSIASNEDVIRVYTNLCKASEAHLRAFTGVLALYGVEYAPVKLSQEEFDRIMAD